VSNLFGNKKLGEREFNDEDTYVNRGRKGDASVCAELWDG
jgi:hypothetical protein